MLMTTSHIRCFTYAIALMLFCFGSFSYADAYEITDSFGKHRLEKPPERVVVTDWALLEQILELGVTPVGAPELSLYRHYVRQPALPEHITDIGLRHSPNLQAIRSLKPDVIIIGTDQKALAKPFSHIAPVLYYNNFSKKYRTNGQKTRVRFLQLAELFQLQSLAENKLAAMDNEIEKIRKKLHRHFDGKLPNVTLMRFSRQNRALGKKTALVYGENSIPLHAMQQLGLTSSANTGRSKWGYQELPISQLAMLTEDVILYIEPAEVSKNFFLSEQWQSLPAVQQKRAYPMKAAWSYGGAISVLYNARAISHALLTNF